MHPYFDPTRTKTLKKRKDDLKKKWKWKTTSNKIENDLKKNGRRPKRMEDDKKIKNGRRQKKRGKKEDDLQKNGRQTNQPKST